MKTRTSHGRRGVCRTLDGKKSIKPKSPGEIAETIAREPLRDVREIATVIGSVHRGILAIVTLFPHCAFIGVPGFHFPPCLESLWPSFRDLDGRHDVKYETLHLA